MSLPGYAWSEAKNTPGMDASAIADMVGSLAAWLASRALTRVGGCALKKNRQANDLMHELGYAQYVAQGGDWGGASFFFAF